MAPRREPFYLKITRIEPLLCGLGSHRFLPMLNKLPIPECGVLTMAFHDEKYLRQAIALARSVRLHNPTLSIAIVTNLEHPWVDEYFDQRIEYREAYGDIFEQKLYLNDYSPYERTLYIDSDCLAYGSLDATFRYLSDFEFWMPGHNLADNFNPYWGIEASDWCQRLELETIARFNAGVFYFDRSKRSQSVFGHARQAIEDYDSWGIRYVSNGKKTDEPCFSLGMAQAGVMADPRGESITAILNEFRGALAADVISGINSCNNRGSFSKVVILHFAGVWQREPTYLRERAKLELLSRGLAIGIVYSIDTVLYLLLGLQSMLLRITRRCLGKMPFPMAPFRFEK